MWSRSYCQLLTRWKRPNVLQVFKVLCPKPWSTEEFVRNCKLFIFNVSTDTCSSIVESLAWIIFPEICSDKSWKLTEIFYFYQINTGIKIFNNKNWRTGTCHIFMKNKKMIMPTYFIIMILLRTDSLTMACVIWAKLNEPEHDKNQQNEPCAGPAKTRVSDQSGHPPSLTRVFACCSSSQEPNASSCGQQRL